MSDKSSKTRREFLQMGTAALAGAALAGSGACSSSSHDETKGDRAIIRRTLGRTGLELPIISMGSAYAIDLVRTALDEGIVYIHTSSGYSENRHEKMLGKVFRGRPRDSFVVATSPDLPYEVDRASGNSNDVGTAVDPGLIAKSMEGSLDRLGLEYVDIYYLCSVSTRAAAMHQPYIEALDTLKRDGKTRFTGIATHANEPEVIRAAADSGFWDVILTAYNFRQSHRADVRSAIEYAAGKGLGVVAMKTQAGVYWDSRHEQMINMKAALKWVLEDKNVHTTIPAFMNFKEMEEDLSVMQDLSLTPEEERDLTMGDRLGFSGHYCDQCGRCIAQCPSKVDIPTLMRSHMYAYGHRKPAKAKETLTHWSASDIACTDCGDCVVECTKGFDVRTRAVEIGRILDVPGEFLG